MLKSWKTTVAGIAAILTGAAMLLQALIGDGGSIEGGIASVMAGVGLLAARDNGVSSESAGAE